MRLTKYEPRENSMFPYQLKDDELRTRLDAIHKLGQLEDIEEKIGIDLVTLFKARKQGVWVKNKLDEIFFVTGNELKFDGYGIYYKYKNNTWTDGYDLYGKTWALTKEELL